METEYRSIEYCLHENLVKMQEMLSLLEFDAGLSGCMDACKTLIRDKSYSVAVMGEFRRGKSSLINALLGAKILPADVTPTTATVNRITYGPEPRAVLHFHEGPDREIPIQALADYVTKTTEDGAARALAVREAVVFFPTVICQNHVDIIDTPGLNDEARMTQITLDMIAHVDAVLIPIHARAPFSELERNFVCQLIEHSSIQSLMFVITFLDQLDEDDYDYDRFTGYLKRRIQSEVFQELERRGNEAVLRRAHALLDDLSVCGISSAQALESFVTNSRTLREKSRFEPFRTSLLHTVTARQLESAVSRTVAELRSVVSQFDAQNQKRLAFWDAQRQELQQCGERLRSYCAGLPQALDSLFLADYDALQDAVHSLSAAREEMVQAFIRELSQIRVPEDGVIRSAMARAAQDAGQVMTRRQSVLRSTAVQAFSAVLAQLEAREAELLSALAAGTVPEEARLAACTGPMLAFIDTAFSGADFAWTESYLPQAPNLADCNVIETAAAAADRSVAGHIALLEQLLTAVRRNWFEQVSAYGERLLAGAEEALARRWEDYDLRYKAYLRNYQEFRPAAEEILRQCEAAGAQFGYAPELLPASG